jgi:hypothetical protein
MLNLENIYIPGVIDQVNDYNKLVTEYYTFLSVDGSPDLPFTAYCFTKDWPSRYWYHNWQLWIGEEMLRDCYNDWHKTSLTQYSRRLATSDKHYELRLWVMLNLICKDRNTNSLNLPPANLKLYCALLNQRGNYYNPLDWKKLMECLFIGSRLRQLTELRPFLGCAINKINIFLSHEDMETRADHASRRAHVLQDEG